MSWLETYRGTVYRWEVDNVDHFTVAFYFARLEDAREALLHAVELDAEAVAASGAACVTVECYVRYLRELRVGDILHIRTGVVGVEDEGLRLVHEVIDSGDGTTCTIVEERVALVDRKSRTPGRLTAAQRSAASARRVEPPTAAEKRSAPARPTDDARFIDSARDAIKPTDVDLLGEATLSAYIHRFTAANAHVLAAFGLTPEYCRQKHRGFSTFEFDLRVPGVLRAGDLLLVRSALVHVGNSSMRILHRVTNARTGALAATLEQAGVNLDLDARRPSPLPPPLRERALAMLSPA
jgi:acyl-CoA thioesterase FadM